MTGIAGLQRIVPELEILTTFLDLTLNFVTLIGRPQWNGRFFWQASLFHLPPKFSVRSRSKVTGTEFGNCTYNNKCNVRAVSVRFERIWACDSLLELPRPTIEHIMDARAPAGAARLQCTKMCFYNTRKTPGFTRLCSRSRFRFVEVPRLFLRNSFCLDFTDGYVNS